MSKRFYSIIKRNVIASEIELKQLKDNLLNSKWCINGDVISTYPAKQLYVTTQSLLDQSKLAFMESLNLNNKLSILQNVNDLFKIGHPIPIGYSLAYGNPLSNEFELGLDGYDNYHAPVLNKIEFFKRRMWVGGSFNFNKENPLKFGDILNFTETVDRVQFLTKNGLIFANYKREFGNEKGKSIVEKRSLCYLTNTFENAEKETDFKNFLDPEISTTVIPTIITNFRMSAITFNSHQIHYNPNYAKSTENYPDIVVEAPLLISLALQFWMNHNPNKMISSFKYKIISPSFINKPITINYSKSNNNIRLWMKNDNSNVCFDSTIQI
jgi:hydroxyacyl-ACP dehydratase HTD2-like protein with hotdog domain